MTENSNHAARNREHPDPHEQGRPVPKLVLGVVALMLAWAVGYIVTQQGNDAPELGDHRTLATLEGKSAAPSGSADGAQVYAANCVACHQSTGGGLAGVFPPLASSEWVLAADKVPVNIVLHGITGSLTVKNVAYSGQMPAFKDKLNDAEIAAVLTYVRSNFGNGGSKIAIDVVTAERARTATRSDPWSGDAELKQLLQ